MRQRKRPASAAKKKLAELRMLTAGKIERDVRMECELLLTGSAKQLDRASHLTVLFADDADEKLAAVAAVQDALVKASELLRRWQAAVKSWGDARKAYHDAGGEE